jgi:predicted transcriptional regulator
MSDELTEHIATRVNPEDLTKLERLARQEDRSLSYLIRKAVREMINRDLKVET